MGLNSDRNELSTIRTISQRVDVTIALHPITTISIIIIIIFSDISDILCFPSHCVWLHIQIHIYTYTGNTRHVTRNILICDLPGKFQFFFFSDWFL